MEEKSLSDKISLYAEATKLSLENAEQWIKDAKLLIANSSYGHANALVRFGCEEIAKTYVCWLTSEKILPIDNTVVEDVFWNHTVKNEVILGVLLMAHGISKNPKWKEMKYEDFKLSKEQTIEFGKQFEAMLKSTNRMRQKAMYVDVNAEKKELTNPLKIDEKDVNAVLEVSTLLFEMMKNLIEETSEEEKEKWRKAFASVPKEFWETGEIPIQWFSEKEH